MPRRPWLAVTAPCLAVLLPTLVAAAPLLIAHRGAPAHRPEHTLVGYRLAIAQGADFIEPDLVVTRDGVLVARHDVLLARVDLRPDGTLRRVDGRPSVAEATTDVADHPEFAERLTARDVDGELVGGWFAEDFTLAELRTLRARERMPGVRPSNTAYRDEPIPTFAEIVALANQSGVGLYPELKHPTYLLGRGHDIVELFARAARDLKLQDPTHLFVQCFEVEPLLRLHELAPDLPRVQLLGATDGDHGSFSYPWDVRHHAAAGEDLAAIYGELAELAELSSSTTYADLVRPAPLRWMAKHYATGIGPWIGSLDLLGAGVPWMEAARAAGLKIHPYTVRPEARFRALRSDGRALGYGAELRLLVERGADGFFVEDIEAASRALAAPGRDP